MCIPILMVGAIRFMDPKPGPRTIEIISEDRRKTRCIRIVITYTHMVCSSTGAQFEIGSGTDGVVCYTIFMKMKNII